jgi:hypothetical protein
MPLELLALLVARATRLLGEPLRQSRLSVDVPTKTVTLDGKTYGFDDPVPVVILHELVKANGRPITRAWLRQHPVLKDEERLDWKIADIRTGKHGVPFCIPIQTAEKESPGYLLPPDYLA